jgi:CheY-like chemotaxis protein
MQPLVLAIEPDTRQAAIVKRIVREKVLADVTVVDSREAALEAMRTTIPDVLLLSALLSPRDEDELIAHLRTLRDAEHLQTHTIPQLASSLSVEDEKPRGLLSAFRRKKGPEAAPAGCDPDLFADEIRAYLKRASDKKKEVRETGPIAHLKPAIAAPAPAAAQRTAAPAPAASEPAGSSSWESPFEWKPAPSRAVVVEPLAPLPAPEIPSRDSFVTEPEPFVPEPVFSMPEPEPEPVVAASPAPISDWRSMLRDGEPAAAEPLAIVSEPEPAPYIFTEPEPEPAPAPYLEIVKPAFASHDRYPLTMRTAKGWWFVEGKDDATAADRDPELREVLAGLAVPLMIAAVTYADGCRIRRVRLNTAAA